MTRLPQRTGSPGECEEAGGTLTSSEGYPAGVLGGLASPVGGHQQAAGDGEGDDAHDDEEECGDPLGGQPRRDAGPVAPMDGLALAHQPHRESPCGKGRA